MSNDLALSQAILNDPAIDKGFRHLYGTDSVTSQKKRYMALLDRARKHINSTKLFFISAPGRTELGGNHTDHNNGRVLASAVDLDCVALIAPREDKAVSLWSDSRDAPINVDLTELIPAAHEKGTPEALIRGVASGLQKRSEDISGFNGFLHSTCQPGTGLSSSAAFSVLIGAAISCLGNKHDFDPVELASIACAAENNYFGKPCGPMDQISSAVGGTIGIDFKNPKKPAIVAIERDLNGFGYHMVIVNSGGSHAELTPQYAAIPEEIEKAIKPFGMKTARGITIEMVLERIAEIRGVAGDRACLRLMHFIKEDRRAAAQMEALQNGNFRDFLRLVTESGNSSCALLQNCSSITDTDNQGVLLALALTKELCPKSVCRVHGGGFAGTIQAYIPENQLERYSNCMNVVFGNNAVIPVRAGRPGVCSLTEDGWFFPKRQEHGHAAYNNQ